MCRPSVGPDIVIGLELNNKVVSFMDYKGKVVTHDEDILDRTVYTVKNLNLDFN